MIRNNRFEFERRADIFREGFCKAGEESAEKYVELYESSVGVCGLVRDGLLRSKRLAKYHGALRAIYDLNPPMLGGELA